MFLLKNDIKESEEVSLSDIWSYSKTLSETTTNADAKKRFLEKQNDFIQKFQYGKHIDYTIDKVFEYQEDSITARADIEKSYWDSVIQSIKGYSREKAIGELLKEKKIDKKILHIDKTVKGAKKTFEAAK